MRPLLHIGYYKTGTTFLQTRIFPEPGFSLVAKSMALWSSFVEVDPFAWSPSKARETFEPGIRAVAERGLVPVLSAERLSGNPDSGGYDSVHVAEYLAATFPEARVLIMIREQADMLVSSYKRYVRNGGPGTLRQYGSPPWGPPRPPHFDLSYFEYHRLIGLYRNLFGPENVLVLPYELLRDQMRTFLKRLGDFAGAATAADSRLEPVNVSLSAFSLTFKRHANRWVVRDPLNPTPPFEIEGANQRLLELCAAADPKVPSRLRKRSERRLRNISRDIVGDRYAESNTATSQLTNLDLRSYGYA